MHLKCCPHCYHKSPHPDISQRLICSQCPHETCSASFVNNFISVCTKCRAGYMILNRSINNSFYLSCNQNRCNHILVAIQSAQEVKRSKLKCVSCSWYKLIVDILDQVYLNNPVDYIETCVFCDDRFAPYIYEPNPLPKSILEKREPPSSIGEKNLDFKQDKLADHRKILNVQSSQLFSKKRVQNPGLQLLGADPFHRRENKSKINQNIKQNKLRKTSLAGSTFSGLKAASNLGSGLGPGPAEAFASLQTMFGNRLDDSSAIKLQQDRPQFAMAELDLDGLSLRNYRNYDIEDAEKTFVDRKRETKDHADDDRPDSQAKRLQSNKPEYQVSGQSASNPRPELVGMAGEATGFMSVEYQYP